MDVPGAHYRPSAKIRPSRIPQMEYAQGAELRKVHKDGWISYKGKCIEVGCGLHGERVEIRQTDYGFEIYYGKYRLQGRRPQDINWTRDDKVGGRRRKR